MPKRKIIETKPVKQITFTAELLPNGNIKTDCNNKGFNNYEALGILKLFETAFLTNQGILTSGSSLMENVKLV